LISLTEKGKKLMNYFKILNFKWKK